MRVVVCTDRIGALASADAGAALGRAFVAARPGTQVAVVPIASGGPDLALALPPARLPELGASETDLVEEIKKDEEQSVAEQTNTVVKEVVEQEKRNEGEKKP